MCGNLQKKVPSCTFSDKARRNSLVFLMVLSFYVFFNMAKFCQILTLFAQVMMSEANGTNYDGYIRYRP